MSANKSLDIFAANIIHLFDPAKKNSCFFKKSYNFILLVSTLYFNPLLTKPTHHPVYTISPRLLRIQNKPRVNSELVHFRPSAMKLFLSADPYSSISGTLSVHLITGVPLSSKSMGSQRWSELERWSGFHISAMKTGVLKTSVSMYVPCPPKVLSAGILR